MKKFLIAFFAFLSLFFFAACTPTQETREGASFVGLTKYYIMPVNGGDNFFRQLGSRKEYDEFLHKAIVEFLAPRGFENVSTQEEAQFALRPIYSEWNDAIRSQRDYDISIPDTLPIGVPLNQIYLNLEIEAYLPHMEKWAWRGFSYIKLSRDNMTLSVIREQVQWALQHFPPDQYPSQTQMNAQKEDEASDENAKKN